jgi:hypothetical protein
MAGANPWPPGRWPKGTGTSWPEYYALHLLRTQGLPRVAMTQSYLRGVLETLLAPHVSGLRDYHVAKSKRLHTVHHRLDKLSERLFLLAVLSVSTYLVLALVLGLGYMPHEELHGAAKIFSLLGVMFPTFGAALAGTSAISNALPASRKSRRGGSKRWMHASGCCNQRPITC